MSYNLIASQRLPLELLERCLSYTDDPHLLLYLESVSHAIHAARLLLPGTCQTHVGQEWAHSIHAINRLAALHHQLDRVASLTIHVDRCERTQHQQPVCIAFCVNKVTMIKLRSVNQQ
jgi:uncharacterized protein YerC